MSSACCGSNGNTKSEAGGITTVETVTREDVREFYSTVGVTPQPSLCCATIYEKEDIAHIPQEVLEVSYGCGSPVMQAGLKPGEVHVDLGSGGGVDCFIASKIVGQTGRVVGIDMTPEMMVRAMANANKVAENLGYRNVEFRHGFLEEVPLNDEIADLVTSNCVVNLSPDKKKVFGEIKRILKSGGRFVISDIVSEVEVPKNMQKDKLLWGECISGALTEQQFVEMSKETGFYGMQILSRTFYKEVEGFKFWSLTLRGWKFNKGASCVYTGQYATYKGPFSQVNDDDGHTYLRNVPFEICTDTAQKLSQSPYARQFIITDPTKKIEDASSCCPPSASHGKNGCC